MANNLSATSCTFYPPLYICVGTSSILELKYTQVSNMYRWFWTVHAWYCSRPKWDIVAQSVTVHHTLTWNSTMHDLSKTIVRHGVPMSIHKLPIYLICPHTLFFSSILRLPILQLFLCHIHLCPCHATHNIACNMHA